MRLETTAEENKKKPKKNWTKKKKQMRSGRQTIGRAAHIASANSGAVFACHFFLSFLRRLPRFTEFYLVLPSFT